MSSELQKMVNTFSLNCLNQSQLGLEFKSYTSHVTEEVKFKNIELVILDLSLAYYYHCQSNDKNKMAVETEENYKNLLEHKKELDLRLKKLKEVKEELENKSENIRDEEIDKNKKKLTN